MGSVKTFKSLQDLCCHDALFLKTEIHIQLSETKASRRSDDLTKSLFKLSVPPCVYLEVKCESEELKSRRTSSQSQYFYSAVYSL